MSDFDRWQERFATEEYLFGTEPNAFVARNAHRIPSNSKVLSIADGEGRNGVYLAGLGHNVTAQDISSNGQAKAKRLASERGVTLEWELSNILERAWDEDTYDAVVGIFFQFLSPADRACVFEGIKRTVRPGGLVLIEGYGPKQLEYANGGPKIAENLYSEALMREAFGDLTEIEIEEYVGKLSEGNRHVGMSSLVDMVARC